MTGKSLAYFFFKVFFVTLCVIVKGRYRELTFKRILKDI